VKGLGKILPTPPFCDFERTTVSRQYGRSEDSNMPTSRIVRVCFAGLQPISGALPNAEYSINKNRIKVNLFKKVNKGKEC
jgi:hypothetical protein